MEHQRSTYYRCADMDNMNLVKKFDKSLTDKKGTWSQKGMTFIDLQKQWIKYFDALLSLQEELPELPPSWSKSSVLPIGYIIIQGEAGSGKTYYLNTLLEHMGDLTVSAYTKKATLAFLKYYDSNTIPGGTKHIYDNLSICKSFQVNLYNSHIKQFLEEVATDKELEASYVNLSEWYTDKGLENEYHNITKQEDLIRKHFQLAANKLRKLVRLCTNELLTKISKKDISPEILYYKSKANDPLPNLKCLEALNIKYLNKEFKNENITQDTYRLLASLVGSKCLPSPSVLFRMFLFDEDGQCPAFYHEFRCIMLMIELFIFKPPALYQNKIPIIISTGSTTQSSAIKYDKSCLDLLSSPIIASDQLNSFIVVSDFYRRSLNNFDSIYSRSNRVPCISLEKHLEKSTYTYATLFLNQVLPEQVADSSNYPNGTRLYSSHSNVSNFIANMNDDAKKNQQSVFITDFVILSDQLVIINCENPEYQCKYLSCLTDEEANDKRINLWKRKLFDIYKDFLKIPIDAKDFSSISVTPLLNGKADIGFVKEHEAKWTEERRHFLNRLINNKKRKADDDGDDDYIIHQDKHTGMFILSERDMTKKHKKNIDFENTTSDNDKQVVRIKKTISEAKQVQPLTEEKILYTCLDREQRKTNKEITPVFFISGKAKQLLSKTEHLNRRCYALTFEKKLGDGRKLANAYVTGSKSVDHAAMMRYQPDMDIVVEYGDASSLLDNNLAVSFDGSLKCQNRQMFLTFTRKRYMKVGSPVTLEEKQFTKIMLVGVKTSLTRLITSHAFRNNTNVQFRLMVLEIFLRDCSHVKSHELSEVCVKECLDFLESKNCDKDSKQIKLNMYFFTLWDIVVGITNTEPECANLIHEIVIFNSRFYKYFKYENAPKSLKSMCKLLTTLDSVKVLGNGNMFPTMTKIQQSVFNKENAFLKFEGQKRHITPSEILSYTIQEHFPTLLNEATSILLVEDCILVKTIPYINNKIAWQTVLTPSDNNEGRRWGEFTDSSTQEDSVGIMFRSGMSTVSHFDKRNLINGLFIPEIDTIFPPLINLPRPFKINAVRFQSDVIVVTKKNLYTFCRKKEFSKRIIDDIRYFESCILFGCFSPVYTDAACTVAYAQGSTHNGYVVVDLTALNKSNHLVAFTRVSDAEKLKLANISSLIVCEENGNEIKQRKKKNFLQAIASNFYHYRQ